MSEYKLAQNIISLSESDQWHVAKTEWTLHTVYEVDQPETCLCGHFPIKELCVLSNRHNGKMATVGNHCVKKFLGLPSDKIFRSIKVVKKDEQKNLNPDAIDLAFDRKWINDWERDFYLDIIKKRKLTPKQQAKKTQINRLLLKKMRTKPSP